MQIAPFEIIGYFHLCHWDKDGNLTEVIKRNLVVNVGRDICKERIGRPGTAIKAANWIGLGTGTTAPAAGDTGLAGEITRKEGVYSSLGIGSWKEVATWGPGEAVAALSESGIFAGTEQTMLARVTFAVINKADADTISVTWGFTIS